MVRIVLGVVYIIIGIVNVILQATNTYRGNSNGYLIGVIFVGFGIRFIMRGVNRG